MTDPFLPDRPRAGGEEAAHDEGFEELAVGWALHALDDEDRVRFAEHLPGCDRCRAVVDETVETLGDLATAVPEVEPPAGLRARLHEAVAVTEQLPQPVAFGRPRGSAQQPRRRRVGGMLLAAAAAAVVGLGVWNIQLGAARDQAQAEASAQSQVVQALLEEGPGTLVPVAGDDGRTVATVFQHDGGAQVVTHGLSANDRAGSVYVLWGLGADRPEALGTFDVTGAAPSLQPVSVSAPPEGYAGYAISIEPGRVAPPAPTVIVGRTVS